MAKQTKDTTGSSEELLLIIKDLVEPIDFDSLIETGVLEEKGDWYKVNKIGELPKEARSKIRRIKIGPTGTLLRFRSPNKKLEKLLIQEAKLTPVITATDALKDEAPAPKPVKKAEKTKSKK